MALTTPGLQEFPGGSGESALSGQRLTGETCGVERRNPGLGPVLLRWPWSAPGESITQEKLKHRGHRGAQGSSLQEHAVAVGVETITLFDGVVVGAQDSSFAGEGAHQHEQRGLRQMEVGKHPFYYLEVIAWINENVGFARFCFDAPRTVLGRIFQSADRGSTDGDDAASVVHSLIDLRSCVGGDRVRLGM